MKLPGAILLMLLLIACTEADMEQKTTAELENASLATFAGGCFWCMEPPFEKLDGVLSVTSGYAGGEEEHPTYDQVSSGSTGHLESIQIAYDPGRVSYEELLEVFWQQIDPTDAEGQFVDRGGQYATAIFAHDELQRNAAEESKRALNASGRYASPVITPIIPFTSFYPAEEYHQDYYKKNPLRYKFYRSNSGRDQYLEKVWSAGNPNISKLTPLQYEVTQQNGTERPFQNEYWDNHAPGIYVDVVSGEPLFSSIDKFESGTGWPSFTKPLEPGNIVEREDNTLFSKRTEVRSKQGDSHLGHLFPDGPAPSGLRYCMNSASLRFIPAADLEKEGYGQYASLFVQ